MEHMAKEVILKSKPAGLDDTTKAQLRNEWAILLDDAERVMPTLRKHGADIDRVRLARSIERINTILTKD